MLQNVKPNWNETDSTSDAYIQNKPTIPAAQVQADWDESDSSDVSFIKNKPNVVDATDYLYFEQTGGKIVFRLNKIGTPDPISLEYRINDGSWQNYTWDGDTGEELVAENSGDKIFLRATTYNDHICKDASNGYRFVTSWNPASVGGNLLTLKDKQMQLTTLKSYDFYGLFQNTNIRTAPKLTSNLVENHAYECLFKNCYSLISCPELPAYYVHEYGYANMFENCISLKNALSYLGNTCFINKSSNYAYKEMFKGCTSLINGGNLTYNYSDNYISGIYQSMFEGCTSLAVPPVFPYFKTNVNKVYNNYAFQKMFKGCTSLETPPEFPSNLVVANNMFEEAFMNCTSLKKTPDLPYNKFGMFCYKKAFEGCTSLTEVRNFETTTYSSYNCCDRMFAGCTSLKSVVLKFDLLQYGGAGELFDGCTSLEYLKVAFTTTSSWGASDWMRNVSATGIFDCPSTLDTSTRGNNTLPAGWTVVHGSNEPDADTTSTVEAMTTDSYMVFPSSKETGVLTVDSALTLNAMPNASTEIAYAEVVLDIAANATVTAGTNITFVDEPADDQRNICVVRWQDGVAKLFVVTTEELS